MNKSDLKIVVVPYNTQWLEDFTHEAAAIQKVLGDNCLRILHIGSTSIPGLAAKPTIDMIPVVKDILAVDAQALEKLGYTNRGELGMLFRRFFTKGEEQRTHHLHVWEEGNPEIDKHLMFRDHLISHRDDLKRYEDLKLHLAKEYESDRNSYTFGKDELVRKILDKAGFQGITMVQALTTQEWNAVKSMRQRYFFDAAGIQDPYAWTFDHDAHFHIVLKKGTNIIGYAHLQFWPDQRAALRIIVIEEAFRNQGYGRKFLKSLERWAQHQGMKSLHTQASPKAYPFYKKSAFTEMPFQDPDGYESDPNDTDMGKVITQ